MGVMLFPSFLLGNAFGGGGASFAPHSLFFSLSSSSSFLPLLPSFLPQLSHLLLLLSVFRLCPLLFFLFSFLPITLLFFFFFFFFQQLSPLPPSFFFFSFLPITPLFFFFLFCLSPLSPFFFFEGIACTKCFSRCKGGYH